MLELLLQLRQLALVGQPLLLQGLPPVQGRLQLLVLLLQRLGIGLQASQPVEQRALRLDRGEALGDLAQLFQG